MGNKPSQEDESCAGAEMSSAKQFVGRNQDTEPLSSMDELWIECLAVKEGAQLLTESIDEIFLEDEDIDESASEMEERLHDIIVNNQAIVHRLTRNLERHAKLVDQGPEQNERLMAVVKNLVSTINNYMTMLIRNIRKLKRLLSEMKPVAGKSCFPKSGGRDTKLIYDVISDHQDVDAMLVQLLETEKHREELEKDIVTVLVFWRDYRYLHLLATEDVEEVENNVKIAADSVAHGLQQLSTNK